MPTPGMEEHLEQIYALSQKTGYTRVSDVAEKLSVHVSSASRMAQKLGDSGYVIYEKYGRIFLTNEGLRVGEALLYRHKLLERFLKHIGIPKELIHKEVEQIEHHFSWETLGRIDRLVCILDERPEIMRELLKP